MMQYTFSTILFFLSLILLFAIQTEVTTAYTIPSYKRERSFNVKLSSMDDCVCRRSHGTSHYEYHQQSKICRRISPQLRMVQIAEFGDADEEQPVQPEKPTTYGYEGNFQVGDIVKVTKPIRIWSVKQYMKEGFVCEGFVGKVVGLALYGRKFNSLCSAITPVKVEFQPDHDSIPPKMFDKKWLAHFAATELELISSPSKLSADPA